MVQVQSSWFPLYDRNPQKFVDNINKATDADYVKATQRVYRSKESASSSVLPVLQIDGVPFIRGAMYSRRAPSKL
jgi:uncharacterized protein